MQKMSASKSDCEFGQTVALASRAEMPRNAVGIRRAIVVFSRDDSIVKLIGECISDSWVVEKFCDAHEARAVLGRPGVGIVVIDDEAVEEATRGWLLEQVRKRAPHALVVYIAGNHSPDTERRARAYRVQYYTSKPMDRETTRKVLHSFERAAR